MRMTPLTVYSLVRVASALWRQIVGRLTRDIASGGYKPGGQLPTEAVLSARFGVNRHTVRRALEEMSRDGLVRIEQGRGTFVAEDVLDLHRGGAHAVLGVDTQA